MLQPLKTQSLKEQTGFQNPTQNTPEISYIEKTSESNQITSLISQGFPFWLFLQIHAYHLQSLQTALHPLSFLHPLVDLHL